MVQTLQAKWNNRGLRFGIGGSISFDVVPQGWDKTVALKYLGDYRTIHFFGDRTGEYGNDREIYNHER
ncbi:eukaryotic phosphomannomutase [Kipferlia bialata]|uniref:Phosphomannomutase n=1 Tax=Kipferlia bialata TaxID=797122 RepID=A0A9K3GLA2_9EUKA|nr:eukaryotic phosphomannomutase [Kipferlia bialata]|eukprot:g8216.t1